MANQNQVPLVRKDFQEFQEELKDIKCISIRTYEAITEVFEVAKLDRLEHYLRPIIDKMNRVLTLMDQIVESAKSSCTFKFDPRPEQMFIDTVTALHCLEERVMAAAHFTLIVSDMIKHLQDHTFRKDCIRTRPQFEIRVLERLDYANSNIRVLYMQFKVTIGTLDNIISKVNILVKHASDKLGLPCPSLVGSCTPSLLTPTIYRHH